MKKIVLLMLMVSALLGCATYDWSFNKGHEQAQAYIDEMRHVRGRLDQGMLP
jgi:hypothetical protein